MHLGKEQDSYYLNMIIQHFNKYFSEYPDSKLSIKLFQYI